MNNDIDKFIKEYPIAAREIEEILFTTKDDALKLILLKELFYHTIKWERILAEQETKKKIFEPVDDWITRYS